jgi:PAS domain-containing protein
MTGLAVWKGSGMDDTQRTRDQLIEELNMFRTLVDSLPDHIYAKDKEGRFILVGAAQARYMGAENPGELVGKSDLDFYPPSWPASTLPTSKPS